YLLQHERSGIAGVARSKKGIERLKQIASVELDRGAPIIQDPEFAKKIAELEVDLTALEFTELRELAATKEKRLPGAENMLKIKGTEIQQRITELTLEAVGVYGAPYFRGFPQGDNQPPISPDYAKLAAPTYANMRKTSIYGGSNEVQHEILVKVVLGI
ncbi:MAG TPA: acyl-CoA dehydrogenase family protein, partial [Hyphomonadaceae bacterium]|nr:acyl-CoA dehydrogenase family protein [Hyphomonadaceae bacterium]